MLKELTHELNYIFTSHGDNGGFIDYRSTPGFERDVDPFFTGTIFPLLAQADEKQTAEYRKWFEESVENEKIVDYIQDAVCRIYFKNFTDEESLQSKIRWLNSRIEKTQNGEMSGSEWTIRFKLEADIKKKIECMQKLNYSREEIFSLMSTYSEMPEICMLLVDDYCSQKEYGTAEKLLLHLKEENAMYPGILCDADNVLKRIYKESGQKEKYIQMLQHLVKTDIRNTWGQYLEYKSLFTASEWRQALHEILALNLNPELENRIYIEENMIDDLFCSVSTHHRNYHSLRELDAYEKYLCPEYEQQIAGMYEECLSDAVKPASNRGLYKELAGYLKKLHKYGAGKEKAAALKQLWMQEYKRRPALMEELGKLKF